MGRSLVRFTALVAAACLQPASAQNFQIASASQGWKAEVVPSPAPVAPAPVGFDLAPGVTFVPSAFSEIGYDTNPGQTFYAANGSGFVRSGAGFNLNSVSQTMVANLAATASMLNYFENDLFSDPNRFSGAAAASVTYLVQPGVTGSSSAFVNYDGQNVNKSQSAGANTELAYRDDLVASIFRGKLYGIQYLDGGLIASPISLTSAFNYNRTEGSWTGLLGVSSPIAPYVEIAGARVEYTDQPAPALIDRSANDYRAKAGVHLVISPELSGDAGWRYNWRDTDDRRAPFYDSSYFDGNLTWRPSPFFALTASAERYIGEPSTSLAVLADVRSYTLRANYLPVPGVTMTAGAGWRAVTEIGSGVSYHAPAADAKVAWDYNNHVQFYTALSYQNYEFDQKILEYNDLRVWAGFRIIPDGQDLLNGESLESLFARLHDSHLPNAELTVSGGYSWFSLPDMKMVTVAGGPFMDKAVGQATTGAGGMDGWRVDAGLVNVAHGSLPNGYTLDFGVSGFFAGYGNEMRSRCKYDVTFGFGTDCALVNPVDFDPIHANNTGPFGDLNTSVNRSVNYYGVSVDAQLGALYEGGLKDAPPRDERLPFKAGLAMRGLDESAKLWSRDPLVCSPIRYSEAVNTQFYGGFVGYEWKNPLGDGWVLGLDASAGLYYASTQYKGRYAGYAPVGNMYLQDYGEAADSLDHGAFIGTLKVILNRDLGWAKAGVFGQGEYLSYAPRIAYNNNDRADWLTSWPISGSQAGTHIKPDDTFNFTTGLSLSVRTN